MMIKKTSTPTVGENVKKYRRIRGFTQKSLAAEVKKLTGKCSQQTINNIENGTILASHFLPTIAVILGVSVEALDHSLGSGSQFEARDYRAFDSIENNKVAEIPLYQIQELKNLRASPKPNSLFSPTVKDLPLTNDIPIYGTIDISSDGFYITDTPIDFITRPHVIKLEPDAFGIIIGIRNMEPAFRIDDIILIHPRKLAKKGDICLFYDGNQYTIGELTKNTFDDWIVQQYNISGNIILPKDSWKKCQVIVGRFW